MAGRRSCGTPRTLGNPANPRLRREWEQKYNTQWPKTATGRNFDVAHIVAKADGGKDHVDNIRPMHPDEHATEHLANGDYARWGRRPSIARAFGGTVARSLGPLDAISAILSIINSAAKKEDTVTAVYHAFGVQTPEDRQKVLDDEQRAINPNWKPSDGYLM